MLKLSLPFLAFSIFFLIGCQNAPDTTVSNEVNSDTVHTGLEGTRDQAGQLSTDVKPDTTGGQAKAETVTGAESTPGAGSSAAADKFMKEQITGNYDEITLAKLASSKSTDQEIKKIADKLISDHLKSLDELWKLSTSKNLSSPASPSVETKSMVSKLEKKQATDFDKAWCEALIEHHKTAIGSYESAAKNVTDTRLKTYINETLPTLRMHLDKLMSYHSQIKA